MKSRVPRSLRKDLAHAAGRLLAGAGPGARTGIGHRAQVLAQGLALVTGPTSLRKDLAQQGLTKC